MNNENIEIVKDVPKLKPRPDDAHKGDFGKIAIIAGSIGMTGAAALAGLAALRAGAGLVRIATPKSALPIVASVEPCFTTIPLDEDKTGKISAKAINKILKLLDENDCLAFGPGVGISASLRAILETLLKQENLKLVIDADGINNLSKIKDWPEILKAELILTPHQGEMNRLCSALFRDAIPNDRQNQALMLSLNTNTTVILKGAATVVTNGRQLYVNTTGNPGMATAGSGDVLTGVLTALWAQGLTDFDAAVLAVYTHGLAGDIAAEKLGQISLIASDITEALPDAFRKI
ncbi:MAG: NAD(P)H-hydrate dehydratase [Planctomycetes bacterium]|nr:NAD(P)H-hydrate dehydratase [Planctomycetota bacterium]